MKPLKLTVCAFGPYASEQVFDFADLNGRSFFLIHGPTGAGKTSILDAMCFALYGQASGSRAPRELRSDHADPKELTQVSFDFVIGPERYRIHRNPEQQRPRKRGLGTMTHAQSATLWRRTGIVDESDEGAVVADGWRETNEAIERLIGFRCDQFRQVVVLPQGRFQELLVAKCDDRQKVLETLFQVDAYGKIEQALKDSASFLKRQHERAQQRYAEALQGSGAATVAEIEQAQTQIQQQLASLHAAADSLRAAKRTAQEKLAEARQIATTLAEFESAKTDLRQRESRQAEFAARQDALVRAGKAARLAELDATVQQRRREVVDAETKRAAAEAALQRATTERERAEAALATETAKQAQVEETRQQLSRLSSLVDRVASLQKAWDASLASTTDHAARFKERDSTAASLRALRQQLATFAERLQALNEKATQAPILTAQLNSIQESVRQRQKLDGLQVNLAAAKNAHAAAIERVSRAEQQQLLNRQALDTAQTHWDLAQAALLAQHLQNGEPCPVCGSLNHPAPAHHDGELPSQKHLTAARKAVDQSEKSLAIDQADANEQLNRVVAANAAIEQLRDSLGSQPGMDLQSLRERERQLIPMLEAAHQAGEERGYETPRRDRLMLDEAALAAKLIDFEKAVQAASDKMHADKATVETLQAEIPERLRSPEALQHEQASAAARLKVSQEAFESAGKAAQQAGLKHAAATEALRSAGGVATTAAQAHELARGALHQRVLDAGFSDAESFKAALLSEAQMKALDEEIRQFNIALGAARVRLQSAEGAAKDLAAPDLVSLEGRAAHAEKLVEENVAQERVFESRLKQVDSTLVRLRELQEELASLDARHAVIGQIAGVANGKNPYNMTFQRYVLGVFLDEVLYAASVRLKIMSRGRFLLRRVREALGGRSAGGLDLEVEDTYTSTARPVSTLSGGESFLASLALALGLADVVQNHSGGIRLETIFVDEGFGTLDPEALDLAIRALHDLQQGGRLVGIISHVTELKEWIDARLEITRQRRGSSARFVVG